VWEHASVGRVLPVDWALGNATHQKDKEGLKTNQGLISEITATPIPQHSPRCHPGTAGCGLVLLEPTAILHLRK